MGLYARNGDGRLGVTPLIGAAVTQFLPGILKSPSERYAGGPLMGTVQAYMNDLALGNVARLTEMWGLANRDGTQGWGAVWRQEVRPRASVFPATIQKAGAALDPQWPAQAGGAIPAPSSVTVAAETMPVSYAAPAPAPSKPLPPVIQEIIRAATPVLIATPTGQQVVREAVDAQAKESYQQAAPWLLPVAIGAAALLLLRK